MKADDIRECMRGLADRDRRRFQMGLRGPMVVEADPVVFLRWRGFDPTPWQRSLLTLLYRWRVDEGGWPTRDGAAFGECG